MSKSKYKVYWTQAARSDLESIVSFIIQNNSDTAFSIYSEIRQKAEMLRLFPGKGRNIPELKQAGLKNYREVIYKVWRIIYRVQDNEIFITAVFDGRRNFEDILLDRLLGG